MDEPECATKGVDRADKTDVFGKGHITSVFTPVQLLRAG